MADPVLDTPRLHHCLDRWRAGDRRGADELVRHAAGRLELLARKLLRGFPGVRPWADPADVLQGALVRLLHALRTVRPASTRDFYNFAAVHIRRELLDLARRYRARNRAEGPQGGGDEALAETAGREPPPDELEFWCRFHEAAEALPAEEREVVGLVFYHGWTHARIAELLAVTERTVRRRWVTACAKLHAALGGDFPPADR